MIDRESETDAAEAFGRLLTKSDQRLIWARLALGSIACARQVADTAWAMTLFTDGVRLNVGQVAVLELWSEGSSVYCLAPVPLEPSAGVRRAKWRHYRAIKTLTERWWVDHAQLTQIPRVLVQRHLALVAEAATAKRGSPFRRSHSPGLVSYLEELASGSDHESVPLSSADRDGLSFGEWDLNRQVELMAVKHATEYLASEGWTVQSVEAENIGYDLFCRRATSEWHVEVKGASGLREHFLLTPNEYRRAMEDPYYVVMVVDGIRSGEARLEMWTGEELKSDFDFDPIGYCARPRAANTADRAEGKRRHRSSA